MKARLRLSSCLLVQVAVQIVVAVLRIVEVNIGVQRIPDCVNALVEGGVDALRLHGLDLQGLHQVVDRGSRDALVLDMRSDRCDWRSTGSAVARYTPFAAAFH